MLLWDTGSHIDGEITGGGAPLSIFKQEPMLDLGSSCRPAAPGSGQRRMCLSLHQGPGWVGWGGSSRRGAPSWTLRADPAVTLTRSSARGSDLNQGPSSGWGLIGAITSAVEPQPQNGYPREHPSFLAALPPPALKPRSQLLLESLSQDCARGLSAHYQDI